MSLQKLSLQKSFDRSWTHFSIRLDQDQNDYPVDNDCDLCPPEFKKKSWWSKKTKVIAPLVFVRRSKDNAKLNLCHSCFDDPHNLTSIFNKHFGV